MLLLNSNKSSYCLQLGYGIPEWLQIISIMSNLCTVIGCSINTIIYNCLKSTSLLNPLPSCICNCLEHQNPPPSDNMPAAPLPSPVSHADVHLRYKVINNHVCQFDVKNAVINHDSCNAI